MRVLWISNILFPDFALKLGKPIALSGGWIVSLGNELSTEEDITLCVAATHDGDDLIKNEIGNIQYYGLPFDNTKSGFDLLVSYWELVCDEFKPDIVHIHGSEYARAFACIKARPELLYLLSIQGIMKPIHKYYFAGISNFQIFKHISIRDILRRDTLFSSRKIIKKQSVFEAKYFNSVKGVLGRTLWDKAHSYFLNSRCKYYHHGEMLRPEFYVARKWQNASFSEYKIFVSQASMPLKGVHVLLEAIALLKEDFPTLRLYIGGDHVLRGKRFMDKLKLSGYGRILKNRIRRLGLADMIIFTGRLSVYEMIEHYQTANVFICPSSIENSSNSIGEAQIIGAPVLASFVGGASDMIKDGESGILYRFEEIEILAYHIKCLFEDKELRERLSKNAIMIAQKRHSRSIIRNDLKKIYKDIMEKNN